MFEILLFFVLLRSEKAKERMEFNEIKRE